MFTVSVLLLSNIFMTVAWYGDLRYQNVQRRVQGMRIGLAEIG